jgi:signal transduction histidine kinase
MQTTNPVLPSSSGPTDASELSLLADRERIGRELNETIIQRLFATGLAMEATAHLAERPEVANRLHQHIDDIDDTIRELRSVIFALASVHFEGP